MSKKTEQQEKVYKVACSIPNEGVTRPESYDNHLVLAFHLGVLQERWKNEKRPIRYEFFWHTTGRILTPMARERMADAALEADADFIMFWDDDMVLPIDMVECLLQDMEEKPEIDILGALAFMRNAPHSPVMFTATEGYDSYRRTPYFKTDIVHNYPRNQVVECDAIGFGAALIRTSVLKKMKKPYFFSTTGSGEDVYFCIKAKKEANARVFMDTRVKLGHLGAPIVVDEQYHDKFNEAKGAKHEEEPTKYQYRGNE